MSNRRRPARQNVYRTGYLRSPAWFARRDRWFTSAAAHGPLTCAGCDNIATARELELHHCDYTRVGFNRGSWRAWERDDDLIPLHPYCHELLHRILDRDAVLSRSRRRRDATTHALGRLRRAWEEPRG